MLFSIITDVKLVLIVLTIIGASGGVILLFINRHYFLSQLRENRYLYLSLAFLIPIGIASIDALYPINKFLLFYTMLPYVFIGILPIYVLATSGNFKRLELLVVIGLLYISLDAILQWLTNYHTLGYNPPMLSSRVYGIFGEWAHISYFLATFSPILFFFFYTKIEKKPSFFNILITFLSLFIVVIAIMLGGARTGIITLLVSLFFFIVYLFYTKRIKHRMRFILISVTVLAIFIFISSFIPVVQDRFITQTAKAFNTDNFLLQFTTLRTNLWYVGFMEIPNYWFNGVGPRGFNFIYYMYPEEYKLVPYVYHPHLHGLEVIIEAGLVGFIPYVFICLYLIKRMITAKAGNMWLIIGFLALMPINSHVALYQDYWYPIVWVPIMIGLALAYQADQKEKQAQKTKVEPV